MSKSITRAQTIETLSKKAGISKAAVERVLAAMSETMLQDGQTIMLPFGKLILVERAAREMKSPRDGKRLDIPARRTITFRPFPSTKYELNKV